MDFVERRKQLNALNKKAKYDKNKEEHNQAYIDNLKKQKEYYWARLKKNLDPLDYRYRFARMSLRNPDYADYLMSKGLGIV